MISFIIPYNHVLESDTKKEPYWNRIPDTRFYPISGIKNSYLLKNVSKYIIFKQNIKPHIHNIRSD